MKPPSLLLSGLALLLMAAAPEQDASSLESGTARNIIFMVPDGMNLANVTAARIYKHGLSGQPLQLERLPDIGYQRTYSASSTVTQSPAASPRAWW